MGAYGSPELRPIEPKEIIEETNKEEITIKVNKNKLLKLFKFIVRSLSAACFIICGGMISSEETVGLGIILFIFGIIFNIVCNKIDKKVK